MTPNVAVETTGAARGFTQGRMEGKAGGGPGAMGKCGEGGTEESRFRGAGVGSGSEAGFGLMEVLCNKVTLLVYAKSFK